MSSASVPSAHCGANTAMLKNGVPNGTLTIDQPRYSLMTPISATTREMRYSRRRAGDSLSVKAMKTCRTRRNWRRHHGSFASWSSSRPREKNR